MNQFESELLKLIEQLFAQSEKEHKAILKEYKNSRNNINQLLANLYIQNANDGVIDYSQLYLTGRLNQFNNEVEQELNNLATKEIALITGILGTIFVLSHYKTAYTMEKSFGIAIDFNLLNPSIVNEFLNFDWSGIPFSERIWNNQRALRNALRTELTRGIREGQKLETIAKAFTKQFGSKVFQSERLVRTETARVISSAQEKIYQESGVVQQVVYNATLDNRTSDRCRSLDGKIFKIDDLHKPIPPQHPSCRSCLLPKLSNRDFKVRKDNETKEIIKYQTYEEWAKSKGIS